MAMEILRFKAIEDAKKSSAKKLEIRRVAATKVLANKEAPKPPPRKTKTD
jgi:hypothetical protein